MRFLKKKIQRKLEQCREERSDDSFAIKQEDLLKSGSDDIKSQFTQQEIYLKKEDDSKEYSNSEDSSNSFNIKQEDIYIKREDISEGYCSFEGSQPSITIKQEEAFNNDINLTSQLTGIKKDEGMTLRHPRSNKTSAHADSKNIIKNYGKALCAFASSKLAIPYIQTSAAKGGYHHFEMIKFKEYMKQKKEITSSMENLRSLLIEEVGDSEEIKAYKRVFKDVSIVFMKYFSVNWIFSGKLVHKIVHLKFRFKMLRRIENPEYFTYLKTRVKNT